MPHTRNLLGLLLALILLPCAQAATVLDRIAVIVNDDVITEQELEQRLEVIKKQLRAQRATLPPTRVLRKQVLEREIIKQIQLQLAKSTGIMVDDNALNATIENIARQNGLDLAQFREVLERDGFDFASFREDIRNEMIIARLQQREVSNRVTVTEQEIDNFLRTQAAQGHADDEYLISHILISVPEAASPEQIRQAREKAERVLAELKAGADFAQMAISVSDSQQALDGGSLGWRKSGQLPTLFASEAMRLHPGELGDIIRSPSGFHIIKLMDKRVGKRHLVTQTLARHILIRPNELTSEADAINQLKQLKARIEQGESFEKLARAHSDDPGSASQGGSLGWVNPGTMVAQFQEVMDATPVGQISEPFKTQFGWHILQVQDRRTEDNSEDFARNQARRFLRQRKIDESLETWLRQLRDEAYVEYKIDV